MQNAKICLVTLSFYNKKYFKKHEIGNKFCRTLLSCLSECNKLHADIKLIFLIFCQKDALFIMVFVCVIFNILCKPIFAVKKKIKDSLLNSLKLHFDAMCGTLQYVELCNLQLQKIDFSCLCFSSITNVISFCCLPKPSYVRLFERKIKQVFEKIYPNIFIDLPYELCKNFELPNSLQIQMLPTAPQICGCCLSIVQ